MNPLERIVIGLILDFDQSSAVSGGKDRVDFLGPMEGFLRSLAETQLLAASTDFFLGFSPEIGVSASVIESELWRRHVKKVVKGPRLVDVASTLFDAIVDHDKEVVGSGIPVRARWALVLSNGVPKVSFGAKVPSGIDHFGQDLVPVLVGTHGAPEGGVWGREALEVRPELLPHFLGDVTAELQRCLWGVSLPAESDGVRFKRWMSGAGRAEPGSTVAGRAGSAPDITINPAIEISVRGGWRPVE